MLSIFIPSFNHAAYVVEALASAQAIDVPDKQIYLIDDASTDDTVAQVENYLREYNKGDITFIQKPKNAGAIDSMVLFLGMCQSELIYTLASDDIAIPDGIAKLVRMMVENPKLGFVIGGGCNQHKDGRLTPLYGAKHDWLFSKFGDRLANSIFLSDPSPLLCQSSVFRLSALQATNAIDLSIVADDYAIFGKLLKRYNLRGTNYEFAPGVDCVRYRHHGSNSYTRLVRQAVTHSQVINAVAPPGLRSKALGYKLSFLMLVAIRRGRLGAARDLLKLCEKRNIGWFFVGLFVNVYEWLRFK